MDTIKITRSVLKVIRKAFAADGFRNYKKEVRSWGTASVTSWNLRSPNFDREAADLIDVHDLDEMLGDEVETDEQGIVELDASAYFEGDTCYRAVYLVRMPNADPLVFYQDVAPDQSEILQAAVRRVRTGC